MKSSRRIDFVLLLAVPFVKCLCDLFTIGDTLKAKWKGLRDNFRVEFKRIPRNENDELLMDAADFDSKWTFYRNLLFLSKIINL